MTSLSYIGMPRLESTIPELLCFSPLSKDLGVTFLERHLTYTGQLEDYISRYKRRPADIKYWPYGPYWPKHFDGFLLNTPRHKWSDQIPQEDDRLLRGEFGKEFNASSQTVDNQTTPFKGKWRGIQVTFDSERSPRDFSALSVPEGCCPSLAFESRFECGNLRQARRIGQFEYELVLKSDLYTARHTQWYYFRVTNVVPGVTYKFRIVNLLKRDSLYNHGMRPLLYSEKDAADNKQGWHRTGHHIGYSRNITNHNCPLLQRGVSYFMLEWQMEFPHAEDTYYLAHCYPYSFTDLKEDLEVMMNSEERAKVTRREVMCETRAGNSCFLLTVSNFNVQEPKKAVVVTARVHPGESQASWMMKGLLEFITGPDSLAQELRNNFVFKIVPMINPDGVIVGNYRCSLAARDLNRNYRHPRRENFPTIWYLKNMMEDLARKYEIALYCDLHGHSRKHNMFMYGNNTSSEGEASALGMARAFISERLFPWLMSQRSPDMFAFKSCKFSVRRCKESTGRVVMWRQMGVFNSFTLEGTFSGTVLGKDNCRHFNILDFMAMGKTLAQAVLDYSKVQEDQAQQTQTVLDLTRVITEQILVSKGLIEPDTTLPDFGIGKDMVESDTAKVKESAEKWTQALLLLLNSSHDNSSNKKDQQHQNQQQQSSSKSYDNQNMAVTKSGSIVGVNAAQFGAGGGLGTSSTAVSARGVIDNIDESSSRPVYTKDDVVAMLGKMTGRGTKCMEDCLGILAQLEAHENLDESDSSDSDSESEPEMKAHEPKPRKKKRKSKKHKDHEKKGDKKHGGEDSRNKTSSTLPSLSAQRQGGSHSAHSDNFHVGKSGKQAASEKCGATSTTNGLTQSGVKQMSSYTSKYQGRHNGGVPCFTEERSMERAAKRMAELRKKHENDPHNRDVAFYCVDDNGVHTMSQEELNQRLLDLAATAQETPTSSSSATPLMGFNVKTGYTHANNLQDLTPPPHQPLNNVGSFLMTSQHTNHAHNKHHQFAFHDIADQSSSEDSESDCCSSAEDNNSTNNNSNNSSSSKFNRQNNNNNIGNNQSTNAKNNLRISRIRNVYTNISKHNTTSYPNGTGSRTGAPRKSNAFTFPITAKKNPYQHLDPLEETLSPAAASSTSKQSNNSSSISLAVQSHPLSNKISSGQFVNSSYNNKTNDNINNHLVARTTADIPSLVSTSNPLFSLSGNHMKSSNVISAISNNSNSNNSHIITNTQTKSNHSSATTSSFSNTASGATTTVNSSSSSSGTITSTKSATATPRKSDIKSNQFFTNYSISSNNNSRNYKNDLKSNNILNGGLSDFKDLKRSKTFYHSADSISSFTKGGVASSTTDLPSTHSLYSHGVLGKTDLKLDNAMLNNGAKKSSPTSAVNGFHKHGKKSHAQIQNVEKLVQQLSENLAGITTPIPTKRVMHYNRNSPHYPSRSTSHHPISNASSPFMTSSSHPTNRMVVLPDCLSPRMDDKTRVAGRKSASGLIRSHRPSPGGGHQQQEYSWE